MKSNKEDKFSYFSLLPKRDRVILILSLGIASLAFVAALLIVIICGINGG